MDVEITRLNGDTFRLSDNDVVARDFIIGSPEMRSTYGEVEGRHGAVDFGATFGMRSITVPIYINAYDLLDVALLRDKLFDLVASTEPFYVREMRRSKQGYVFENDDGGDVYVGGKRYKVRLSSPIELEQESTYGFGELVFETVDSPFAESIGTTLGIDKDSISTNPELWSYGMGLIADPDARKYVHTSNRFRIFNAGNIDVHPFEHDVRIEITGVNGSGFELRNRTTGETFKYNEELKSSDVLVIDGANVTVNSLQALRNTNRRYISFAIGWNDLTTNIGGEVSVDMRFYYK